MGSITVAALSLALGIGANTAIFTLINAVILQYLPVREPGRLVLFNDDISSGVYNGNDFPSLEFSYPSFLYLQSHNDSFESLCAFRQQADRVVMHVAGSSDAGPQERAYVHLVSGNYFKTLGVNAALGRLNETFVRMYLPDQNPIGKRISLGSPFEEPGIEVVGVVADSKYYDLHEDAKPMAFFPIWQRPVTNFEMVLHTLGGPDGVTAEVRHALRQVDSRLAVMSAAPLSRQVERSLRQQRMITSLCSIFGGVALLLAAIGIYGTLAYSVSDRMKEIGVRMAIGARHSNVIWLVLRDSVSWVAAGIFVGLPLGVSGAHWIKSFFFGVPEIDPLAITAAVFLIVILASFAAYFPARRAARIDPMRALRHE
ncbi:MAG: FtsX-like permease family protein [Bryobacteraceae bacterium]